MYMKIDKSDEMPESTHSVTSSWFIGLHGLHGLCTSMRERNIKRGQARPGQARPSGLERGGPGGAYKYGTCTGAIHFGARANPRGGERGGEGGGEQYLVTEGERREIGRGGGVELLFTIK